MKFLCSHCKAKYQIADERVAGRTLRMTCRQCRQEIVIRGDLTPPPQHSSPGMQAPLSPLGSGLAAQFAAPQPAMPMPRPRGEQWHVAINDIPVGPMGRDEVARKVGMGAINGESLAWREGLDDWLPMRQIPELAMLLGGTGPTPVPAHLPNAAAMGSAAGMMPSPMAAPQPLQPLQPAQRQDLAPIGGRAGAGAYGMDDWLPPPPASEGSVSQVAPAPPPDPITGPAGPSWHKMFAAMGAFAFLMAAMTIVGARWLSGDPQPPPAATAPEPRAPEPEPVQEEPEEEEEEEDIVELDLQEIDWSDDGDDKPTRRSKSSSGSQSSASKKQLTAEQRAMLARMGGGLDEGPANIRGAGSSGDSRSGSRSGGLTAQQLSKVVLKGRKNLQRCYETALRGSGSDDTVRLDVEITVSSSGNVTRVNTKGEGLPGMSQCIERTVKMWRFPNSGETTQTKFPVVFQPGA